MIALRKKEYQLGVIEYSMKNLINAVDRLISFTMVEKNHYSLIIDLFSGFLISKYVQLIL
jgi:hypothetical protein